MPNNVKMSADEIAEKLFNEFKNMNDSQARKKIFDRDNLEERMLESPFLNIFYALSNANGNPHTKPELSLAISGITIMLLSLTRIFNAKELEESFK